MRHGQNCHDHPQGLLRVTHVGNSPEDRGGISSVIRNYTGNQYLDVATRTIATYDSTSRTRTVVRFAVAVARVATGRRHRLGVVHVHLSMRGSFVREGAIVVLARTRRAPVVVTVHGSRLMDWSSGHPRLTRTILRRADCTTVLFEAAADRLRALGIDNVVQVPNAVDVPSTITTPTGRPTAVFAGELSRRKGADVLLEAWTEVARLRPSARLLLVGLVSDVYPDRDAPGVHHLDERPHDAILQLLEQAWVAVLPSRFEGMPMFLLEAMAAGCGIVSTPVGGIPELVPDLVGESGAGATGELVAVGEPAALADAIVRALDQVTATQRGEAAHALVAERFNAEVIAARMRQIWMQAAGRQAPSGRQ